MEHPYIKYALALLMKKYNHQSAEKITVENIIQELNYCRSKFSMKFCGILENKEIVLFEYTDECPNYSKGRLENSSNIILSPHVISSDASGLYNEVEAVIHKIHKQSSRTEVLKKSLLPTVKKYLQLSDKGNISRHDTHLTYTEIALVMITTLTPEKPCSSRREKKGNGAVLVNTCLIPDISIEATMDFVSLFNRLEMQKTEGILNGKVYIKGKKKEAERPSVFFGNYPNAAKSPYLQSLSVLGYIGELAKEGDYSSKARKVLEELEVNPVMLVVPTPGSESFSIIHYSHYIIELAKEGALHEIIDSLFYAKYYKYKGLKRTDTSLLYKKYGIEAGENAKNVELEYNKFDFYAKNFLTLFNHYTFCEFLSCRMEYPSGIKKILISYFKNMEQINKEIIESAEAFGAWINRSAFTAALSDAYPGKSWSRLKEETKDDKEKWNEVNNKVTEKKYKFLTNLESSIFSAADNTSMIANIMTQVGRLSNSDAPEDVKPFMEAVFTSSITLPSAKNLLIAFSRVYSKSESLSESNNRVEKESVDSSKL